MNPMPPAAPTITGLQLETAASALGSMAAFYGDLGLDVSLEGETSLSLRVGDARLQFTAANGEPFYHFALLVPGDRFDAAYAWATERIALLDGPGGSRIVDFADWQAKALYLLDPAGNIVELIAHSGVEKAQRPAGTPFDPDELLGISEAAIIAEDLPQITRGICEHTGLELWDGDPATGIAFVGRRAHTLVLSAAGRGLLPTRRPGETHPMTIHLGIDAGETLRLRIDSGITVERG